MNIKELAMKYLVEILNSKSDKEKISKVVAEILQLYPNEFASIIEEIRSILIDLESKKIKRVFYEVSQQANDNYIEYLALLNSAVNGKGK